MPTLHPRTMLVEQATARLRQAALEAVADLTEWEAVRVVTNALSNTLLGLAKYGIRAERHPGDPEAPGDFQ